MRIDALTLEGFRNYRRAALDYAYETLRRKSPAKAKALEAHIAAHTEKINEAKENENA